MILLAHLHTYSLHTHICGHTYTHTHVHTYTHTQVHMYTGTQVHTYTYTYTYTRTHVNTYTRTHTHVHTYTHVPPTCMHEIGMGIHIHLWHLCLRLCLDASFIHTHTAPPLQASSGAADSSHADVGESSSHSPKGDGLHQAEEDEEYDLLESLEETGLAQFHPLYQHGLTTSLSVCRMVILSILLTWTIALL